LFALRALTCARSPRVIRKSTTIVDRDRVIGRREVRPGAIVKKRGLKPIRRALDSESEYVIGEFST